MASGYFEGLPDYSVGYRAEGSSAVRESSQFPVVLPLGARSPRHEGAFRIEIPNASPTPGPFTGQLYRTYWVLRAVLEVSLGFNIRVDAVFTPA